jgi:hypothetical protein
MTFIYQIIAIKITLVILLCNIPMEKAKVHNLKNLLRVTISLLRDIKYSNLLHVQFYEKSIIKIINNLILKFLETTKPFFL